MSALALALAMLVSPLASPWVAWGDTVCAEQGATVPVDEGPVWDGAVECVWAADRLLDGECEDLGGVESDGACVVVVPLD